MDEAPESDEDQLRSRMRGLSTDDLRQIAVAGSSPTWSHDERAAAEQVLHERAIGVSQSPLGAAASDRTSHDETPEEPPVASTQDAIYDFLSIISLLVATMFGADGVFWLSANAALIGLALVLAANWTANRSIQRGLDVRPMGNWLQRLGKILIAAAIIWFVGSSVFWRSGQTLLIPFALVTAFWGTLLMQTGKRVCSDVASDRAAVDPRPPVLLLRSFADDNVLFYGRYTPLLNGATRSLEELLAKSFYFEGPLFAVARPGERLPPLGFARMWLRNEEWQSRVAELIKQAQLILVIAGTSPGVEWEVSQLRNVDDPRKILLIVPPGSRRKTLARWAVIAKHLQLDFGKLTGRELLITFGKDWEPRITLNPSWWWMRYMRANRPYEIALRKVWQEHLRETIRPESTTTANGSAPS